MMPQRDAAKVAEAARWRVEMTMTLVWIARRLDMRGREERVELAPGMRAARHAGVIGKVCFQQSCFPAPRCPPFYGTG